MKHYDSSGKRISKQVFDRLLSEPTHYFIDEVIRNKRHKVVAYRKGKENGTKS